MRSQQPIGGGQHRVIDDPNASIRRRAQQLKFCPSALHVNIVVYVLPLIIAAT